MKSGYGADQSDDSPAAVVAGCGGFEPTRGMKLRCGQDSEGAEVADLRRFAAWRLCDSHSSGGY